MWGRAFGDVIYLPKGGIKHAGLNTVGNQVVQYGDPFGEYKEQLHTGDREDKKAVLI